MQDLQRTLVPVHVQLVPRRAVERASLVGPDLRRDPEAAQKTERSPGDCGIADIEVNRDLAPSLQVDAAGGMEQAG